MFLVELVQLSLFISSELSIHFISSCCLLFVLFLSQLIMSLTQGEQSRLLSAEENTNGSNLHLAARLLCLHSDLFQDARFVLTALLTSLPHDDSAAGCSSPAISPVFRLNCGFRHSVIYRKHGSKTGFTQILDFTDSLVIIFMWRINTDPFYFLQPLKEYLLNNCLFS